MNKIIYIRVKQCSDCPLLRWNHNVEPGCDPNPFCKETHTMPLTDKITGKKIGKIETEELKSFPDWCPLQNENEHHQIKEIKRTTIW